jgi:hypothetical protein
MPFVHDMWRGLSTTRRVQTRFLSRLSIHHERSLLRGILSLWYSTWDWQVALLYIVSDWECVSRAKQDTDFRTAALMLAMINPKLLDIQ